MIGIFDSGIGGIGIYNELKKRLPQTPVLYMADYAFAPYGEKSADGIRKRAVRIVHDLERMGAQMVVTACNTATVLALPNMRGATCIPIVGTVPAIKAACETTMNNHIAVLGTTRTIESDYQKDLIRKFGEGKNILELPAPNLVASIEQCSGPSAERTDSLITSIKKHDADTVVLGCTHFTLVREELQKRLGDTVALIDSNAAVAEQAMRVATQEGIINTEGHDKFISTDPKIALQTRVAWALSKMHDEERKSRRSPKQQ